MSKRTEKTLSKFQNHDFADFSVHGSDYQMTSGYCHQQCLWTLFSTM